MSRRSRRQVRELSPRIVGLLGIGVVVLVMAIALNLSNLRVMFSSGEYTAQLAESGGIRKGDDVRVRGLEVGSVQDVRLGAKYVEVKFTMNGAKLGDTSSASVKSANALGRKFLSVDASGRGTVSLIPATRTDPGYSVNTALGNLTATTAELDVDQVARSFESLSAVLDQTPVEFRGALDGVADLSRTINKRDESLALLLQRSSRVSQVLSDRTDQITAIMSDGSELLQELQLRRDVVRTLLRNVQRASAQLEGLARDNASTLKPALKQLEAAASILTKNRTSLEFAVKNLGPFVKSLGEAVGSGPFFAAYLQNLNATNLVPILPGILGNIGGGE